MGETHDDLRQRLRKARASLDDASQQRAGDALLSKVLALPEYSRSQHIAAYSAVMGEISLEPLIDRALADGKSIYLPILREVDLRFAPYTRESAMRINRFRLPEPDVPDEIMLAPRELDLVLAPLVVFDANCNRIGMGGGYYDRSFEFRRTTDIDRPTLIGVAHELQRVDALQPEPWDVRLDAVASDQHIYRP